MNVNIGGLNINYTVKGSGELIVLLHGWGSNIELFAGLIDLLSKKYRVVAMDMPGFGKSEEPKEIWSVDDYADFVLDFLKAYPSEKITFLGHSFGGRVIIKLMSRSGLPFTVDKIILVDSAGVRPKRTFKQKLKVGFFKVLKRIYRIKAVQKAAPELLNDWRARFGSSDYNSASPTMRQILVKVINEDLTKYFSANKAETLLIWGRNDTETPLSDGQLMEKMMPNSGLVIMDNCGHYPFLENPYVFHRVISSFMNIKE